MKGYKYPLSPKGSASLVFYYLSMHFHVCLDIAVFTTRKESKQEKSPLQGLTRGSHLLRNLRVLNHRYVFFCYLFFFNLLSLLIPLHIKTLFLFCFDFTYFLYLFSFTVIICITISHFII